MWRRVTLALAGLAVLLLAISGPGTRYGVWPFPVGLGLFAGALLLGLAAVAAAIVGLSLVRLRARSVAALALALFLGAASAAVPLDYLRRITTLPYINDISTDTQRPPQFLPPHEYPAHFAELQQIGYPGLRPLEMALPPRQAFALAAEKVKGHGWQITALDESAGRIEAIVTTRWFGFKDDVAIRIAASGSGSRLDMRSRSRVGRSDAGANAHRIQDFLVEIDR